MNGNNFGVLLILCITFLRVYAAIEEEKLTAHLIKEERRRKGEARKEKEHDGSICKCPAPDKRDLIKYPNSSKTRFCGHELQQFAIPSNPTQNSEEGCAKNTIYKCRLVAMDEEALARSNKRCKDLAPYCRMPNDEEIRASGKPRDLEDRICSSTPN